MHGERRLLVIGGGVFGGRDETGPHQFGSPFQIGEHRPRRLFVLALGGHILSENALPVAILGVVRPRFNSNASRAVRAGRHPRRLILALRGLPPGELLTFASEQLGARRQRLGDNLVVDSAHIKPPSRYVR